MLWRRVSFWFLSLLVFAIPIEHKYDKAFRFFSLKLIPQNVDLPALFDKKIYFYLSDLFALSFFILALFVMRKRLIPFLSSKGATYLWALLFLSLVSILFSPLCHYPLLYIRLLRILTPICLFCLIANGFDSVERLTKGLLIALIGAALIQSGLGIAQYATQGALGLRLFGETNEFPHFWMQDGNYWLFPTTLLKEKFLVLRAAGTFPHANVFGGFLAVSILASYSFFCSPRLRALFFFLIPLQFFAMNLAFSRSALFGWLLGTLLWFYLYIKKNGFSSPLRALFLTIVGALLCTGVILYKPIIQRGGIVNYNKTARGSDELRLHYQDIAFKMIKDHPLHGAGFQQLSIRSLDYAPDSSPGVHNIYLYMAAETGILSLVLFLCFVSTLLFAAIQTPFTPTLTSLIAMFIAYLFIGGCDFYPLLFQQGKLPFFIIAGLLGANAMFKKKESPTRENIWKMFDRLSPNYDRLNAILSFGMDLGWRRRAASYLPKKEHLKLLDLASGTADQLIACFESGASIESGIGIDLSSEMLKIGELKLSAKSYKAKIELQRADAEKLPFPDATFDAATFSFGIRNMQNPLLALKEIHRVLKPGGTCIILELSMPPQPLRGPHLFYLRYILPPLGGFFSKNKAAYTYLNQTIETFPHGAAFCALLKEASFQNPKAIPMTLGAVTIYKGLK